MHATWLLSKAVQEQVSLTSLTPVLPQQQEHQQLMSIEVPEQHLIGLSLAHMLLQGRDIPGVDT
jgi:hypothetical protein